MLRTCIWCGKQYDNKYVACFHCRRSQDQPLCPLCDHGLAARQGAELGGVLYHELCLSEAKVRWYVDLEMHDTCEECATKANLVAGYTADELMADYNCNSTCHRCGHGLLSQLCPSRYDCTGARRCGKCNLPIYRGRHGYSDEWLCNTAQKSGSYHYPHCTPASPPTRVNANRCVVPQSFFLCFKSNGELDRQIGYAPRDAYRTYGRVIGVIRYQRFWEGFWA